MTTNPLTASTPASAAAASASASTSTTSSLAGANDPLANEQTFLKLLVSQIQHQDPLNPTDSTQFLQQLTGYSQLEQLIGIRKELTPPATTATTPTTIGTTPAGN
jgi:flagellar basal-body rod modification protein FlgD